MTSFLTHVCLIFQPYLCEDSEYFEQSEIFVCIYVHSLGKTLNTQEIHWPWSISVTGYSRVYCCQGIPQIFVGFRIRFWLRPQQEGEYPEYSG